MTDHLIADLFYATTGKPHPGLPKPVKVSTREQAKRVRAVKLRARERQRAIDAGEIT